MDKLALKQTMMELTEDQMAQASGKYRDFLSSAKLNQEEAFLIDDLSQAVTAADLADAFNDQVHEYEEKLETLKAIDFGPKTKVEPGAVVDLGERHLVIAVSTSEFGFEGVPYIGISTAAPIYKALNGRKSGDTCEFNGKKMKIGDIA